MMFGRRQRRSVVIRLAVVVPEPVLARLEAPDDGVARTGVEAGVLAGRAVAAPDMAACRATAQMEPPPVRREALDAPGTARRNIRVDRFVGHRSPYPARASLRRGRTHPGRGKWHV